MKRFLFMLGVVVLLGSKAVAQPASVVSSPPIPPSPIQEFRQWLSLTPEDLEKAILAWPDAKKEVLRRKVADYRGLAPEERDRRLQMVELRWYLQPLLRTDPGSRGGQLAQVPAGLRDLLTARLAQWDALPAELQKQVLDTELGLRYVARLQESSSAGSIGNLSPAARAQFQEKLKVLVELPPEQRRAVTSQLQQLFELPVAQRQRVVSVLPESERQEMQSTLAAFGRMTPEQRRTCIRSFDRFASMSPQERSEFLRNANRWQSMTDKERKAWKNLVNNMPPMPEPNTGPALPPRAEARSNRVAGK